MKNFYKLKNWNPFRYNYVYIDHINNYSDNLLINIKIKPYGELHKDGTDFIIKLCSIKRKDAKKFENVMNELDKKIFLFEDPNEYDKICKRLSTIVYKS